MDLRTAMAMACTANSAVESRVGNRVRPIVDCSSSYLWQVGILWSRRRKCLQKSVSVATAE